MAGLEPAVADGQLGDRAMSYRDVHRGQRFIGTLNRRLGARA